MNPIAEMLATLLANKDEHPARLNPKLNESDIAATIQTAVELLAHERESGAATLRRALQRIAGEALAAAKH